MRSENPTGSAALLRAFRGRAERASRYVAGSSPTTRWIITGAGAVALAIPLAWGASMLGLAPGVVATTSEGVLLAGGHIYSRDDLAVIERALDLKRIHYRIDDQGHVLVDADHRAEAGEVVAKLAVGPRSVRDLMREAITPSLLESIGDSERKREVSETQVVEELITRNRDIVDAYLYVKKGKARLGARQPVAESAFVRVETRGDRMLDPATVDTVVLYLRGHWPELKPSAIVIIDQKGHEYNNPTDAARSALARAASRQDEIRRQLLDQLDWIKGVHVVVQVIPAVQAVPAVASAAEAVAPASRAPLAGARPPEPGYRGGAIVANRPIDLSADEEPTRAAQSVPVPAASALEAPASRPTAEAVPEHGTVWVKVPRGYYWHAVQSAPGRDHGPTADELRHTAARVESHIREMVGSVVPIGERWSVKVDPIPDETEMVRLTEEPRSSNATSTIDWQTPLAAAGATLAVVLFAFGARAAAGRRAPQTGNRGGYRVDPPANPVSEPGASDRARELVRLNPAAGAGVIERWISQGEDRV
ncbi:MAG: hypothetical protein KGM43_14390 [Planctomycetota bacterium]|nr:hypothetical protein [Planctomycetota bacterium]